MKMLKITDCSDSMMWYRDHIGDVVPFLGTDQDVRGPIYWSREPAGYKNIVFCTDAEVVEVDDQAS